jgi:hypothetical protein
MPLIADWTSLLSSGLLDIIGAHPLEYFAEQVELGTRKQSALTNADPSSCTRDLQDRQVQQQLRRQ